MRLPNQSKVAVMKFIVGLTPFGVIAVESASGRIVDWKVFDESKGPSEVAKMVEDTGNALVQEIITRIGIDRAGPGRINVVELAEQLGKSAKEVQDWSRLVSIELAKIMIRKKITRDYMVVQAVEALDDIDHTMNTLACRLREWYGLHEPELSHKVEENDAYARKVLEGADGGSLMGVSLSGVDRTAVEDLAREVVELAECRKKVKSYVETAMREVAPRLSDAAEPMIGARLIARAGSLERLAKSPSSTVQVLGAEKALFKHIVSHTPSPKHGIIFKHPAVQGAMKEDRGRAARKLAGKIAIAARVDYFKGKQESEDKTKLGEEA